MTKDGSAEWAGEKGRFWAEEGGTYFRQMQLSTTGIEGLWFVYGRAGYLNLAANIPTWLAAWS